MAQKKNTREKISDELDKVLLKVLKEGVPLRDRDGALILKRGKVVKGPPSAAFLNAARQRLRDLGITKVAAQGDSVSSLVKEMGLRGEKFRRLPPLSTGNDAATAG